MHENNDNHNIDIEHISKKNTMRNNINRMQSLAMSSASAFFQSVQ